jgi:mRNA-degrading endonuclease toxin of MazEF toxin-antitoxin module
VGFPEERAGQERTKHWDRRVLLLSNEVVCSSVNSPVVLIAPFSHLINLKAEDDILIDRTDTNGLRVNSRLLLSHIQPLLKEEIEKQLGRLSDDDWDEVKAKLVVNFGLDVE